MKEQIISKLTWKEPIQSPSRWPNGLLEGGALGLTKQPLSPRLEGGEIFMPEGTSEIQNREPTSNLPSEETKASRDLKSTLQQEINRAARGKQPTQEDVGRARKAWQERYIKGRTLTFDERQVVENAIEMGIEPSEKEAKIEQLYEFRSATADQAEKARKDWDDYNRGKNISPKDRDVQRVLISMGISPKDASKEKMAQIANFLRNPEVERLHRQKTERLSSLVPEQEAVRQQREASKGVVAFMQLPTVNPEATEDEILLSIYGGYNRRVGKGLMDIQRAEETIRSIEERIRDPAITPQDRTIANSIIDTIENLIITERQGAEERQRRAATENLLGQSLYTIEEILTNTEVRDQAFNNLFAGVDSTPHEFFDRAFNPLTYGRFYEAFMDLIRNASIGRVEGLGVRGVTTEQQRELREDFQRYLLERRVRQALHDVNAVLYLPSLTAEQLFDHMSQFGSEYGDAAFKTEGVRDMMDLYEAALRENMAQNNGYLRPEAVLGRTIRDPRGGFRAERGEIEEKTKERFRKRNKNRLIVARDPEGNPTPIQELQDWEIDRVFTIARGMMIVTERLLTIAAESRLPEGMAQYSSLFLQSIIQMYMPYRHLLGKYNVAETGLAAYLYKEEKARGLLNILKRWNPEELDKAYRILNKPGGVNELEASDEMRYLLFENPNRAGDIFTWISWRVVNRPDIVSMAQDFLRQGVDKMIPRLKNKYGIPEHIDLKQRIDGVDYSRALSEEARRAGQQPSEIDIIAVNILNSTSRDHLPPRRERESDNDYTRRVIGTIKGEVNEYANWLGTGIRFELLRAGLEGLKSDDLAKRRKAMEAKTSAERIFEQMVRFQPHRLYLVSRDIRTRIDRLLVKDRESQEARNDIIATGVAENEVVGTILDTLSELESTLLNNRERELDAGRTFDSIRLNFDIDANLPARREGESLDDYGRRLEEFSRIMRPRLEAARIFAQKVREDFEFEEVGGGQRERGYKYYDEFINKREVKHGFVLWSGDVPVDELNASAVGQSGGFARKATDNKSQAGAVVEEIKLLANLKNIKHPDQAVAGLATIYEKIAFYDSGKAKEAVADKAEGLAKFFAGDTLRSIPILGPLMDQLGVSSFAQIVYEKHAPVWSPAEVRYFFDKLKFGQYITEEHYNYLTERAFAAKRDVAIDLSSTMAQFITLAGMLYLAERVLKEKQ